jgi:hypothetical protein
MNAPIELKPCPCGSQAHDAEIIGGWMVNCRSPQCGFEAVRDTRDEAVLAWNTRPVEDALRAQILSLHAEAGNAACKATQMASGNRAVAFVVEELHARVAELERALTAEKGCHYLAARLIGERDARLEDAGKRIAELEAALAPFAAEGMTYSPQWEDADRVATSIFDADIHDMLDKANFTVGDLRRAMRLLGAKPIFDTLRAEGSV